MKLCSKTNLLILALAVILLGLLFKDEMEMFTRFRNMNDVQAVLKIKPGDDRLEHAERVYTLLREEHIREINLQKQKFIKEMQDQQKTNSQKISQLMWDNKKLSKEIKDQKSMLNEIEKMHHRTRYHQELIKPREEEMSRNNFKLKGVRQVNEIEEVADPEDLEIKLPPGREETAEIEETEFDLPDEKVEGFSGFRY